MALAPAAAALCVLLLPALASAHARAASGCSSSSSSSFGLYGGAKIVSDTSVPVCVTGQLEVSFSSDAVAPCACGYVGTDSWQPQGGGNLDILTYRSHGRRHYETTLLLGGADSVREAVQRTQATGQTTACSDAIAPAPGSFLSPPVHAGRLVVSLAQRGATPIGTRCAGPLAADLGAALPAAAINLRRVMHGGAAIDLRGARRFSEHGFSGVVRSTLVLRLGRATTSHPSSRPQSGQGRGKRVRAVTVTYRIEGLRGAVVADVRGGSALAECGPLDACGLTGSLGVAFGSARGGSVDLFASAAATRPRRDLLAAVGLSPGGNPAGIGVAGGGEQRLHGAVAADVQQDGACRDQTGVSATSIQLQSHAGRLLVSLSPLSAQAIDPLRTRCPGPELARHALALVTLPRSALRRRVLIVALHGNSFTDGPYRVRTRSTLVLTLRRVRVAMQTFRVPSPPS